MSILSEILGERAPHATDKYFIIGEGIRGTDDILGVFTTEAEAKAELHRMYADPDFDPGNWMDIRISTFTKPTDWNWLD